MKHEVCTTALNLLSICFCFLCINPSKLTPGRAFVPRQAILCRQTSDNPPNLLHAADNPAPPSPTSSRARSDAASKCASLVTKLIIKHQASAG